MQDIFKQSINILIKERLAINMKYQNFSSQWNPFFFFFQKIILSSAAILCND